MLKEILKNEKDFLWLNADESDIQQILENPNAIKLKNLIGNAPIEEIDEQLFAYEFKWNPISKVKIPLTFTKNYPQAISKIITPENYLNF